LDHISSPVLRTYAENGQQASLDHISSPVLRTYAEIGQQASLCKG
jgi:hypothetical protein